MNVKKNVEKEWIRKLTTGKVAENKEQCHGRRGRVRKSLKMSGIARGAFKKEMAELAEDENCD